MYVWLDLIAFSDHPCAMSALILKYVLHRHVQNYIHYSLSSERDHCKFHFIAMHFVQFSIPSWWLRRSVGGGGGMLIYLVVEFIVDEYSNIKRSVWMDLNVNLALDWINLTILFRLLTLCSWLWPACLAWHPSLTWLASSSSSCSSSLLSKYLCSPASTPRRRRCVFRSLLPHGHGHSE